MLKLLKEDEEFPDECEKCQGNIEQQATPVSPPHIFCLCIECGYTYINTYNKNKFIFNKKYKKV